MIGVHDAAGLAQIRAARGARMSVMRRIYVRGSGAAASLGTQEVPVFLPAVLASVLMVPSFIVPTTCVSFLPENLDAGQLTPNALELLQRSPTFRQQCRTIAAAPRARIRIGLGTPNDRLARAETTLSRYEAGAIRADITIRFAESYPEMLGHELEHVAELIDGLSFWAEFRAGRAWMTPSGGFETRRARLAGERIQREFEASAAESLEANRGHAPARRHAIQ